MTDYLVGTGGWAYFNVPCKSPLKAYGELDAWVPKVQEAANGVKKVFGYFNNHYHGYAPRIAFSLLRS